MTQLRNLAILLAFCITLPTQAEEAVDKDVNAAEAAEAAEAVPTDSAFVEGEAHDLSKLKQYYNSIKNVGMDETAAAYIVSGETFKERDVEYTFKSGYLFPIFSGKSEADWAKQDAKAEASKKSDKNDAEAGEEEDDGPPVRGARTVNGFVFIGKGEMAVGFPEIHDAERFANMMVRDWDADVEEMRTIARDGKPFTTDIEQGWVMSANPSIAEFLSKMPMIGGKRTTSYDQPGVRKDSMIVTGSSSIEKSFKQAKRTWNARMEAAKMFRPTPKGAVASDRLKIEKLGQAADTATLFADFLTSTRFGAVMMTKFAPFGDAQDRWLSYVHDPSGAWDSSLRTEVFSAGENEYGQKTATSLGGERFPPLDPENPNSMPWLPLYAHPVWADTTIKAEISKSKFYLNFETTSKLTVRAVGGDLSNFSVYIPKTQAEKNSWEFIDIYLVGEDGEKIDVLWSDREDESWKNMAGQMTLILPTALKEGREATIHMQYKGTWSYYNMTEMSSGSGSYVTSAGLSTGLQDAQPMLIPSFVGQPWKFITRVGVPASDPDLRVSLSGKTIREYEEDGWRYTEAGRDELDALWPNIAVGKWIERDEPAVEDMPRLRIHLFEEEEETIDTFGPEMRRIITFYQQFLGPWPFPEIDLFQAPDMWFGFVWIAPHAMVNLQKTRVMSLQGQEGYFREDTPHLESGVLAHELAHQYWGHVARPGTIKDFWIAETFSELSACLYVGRQYGLQDYDARMNSYKEKWEEMDDDVNASLTDAYNSNYQAPIVYNYGPYVFKMLRARMNDEPFFAGLNKFLADYNEESITTDMLQDTMETAATKRLKVFKADEQENRAVYSLTESDPAFYSTTDKPNPDTIRAGYGGVIYDGGFTYDAENNTVTFEGDYIPTEGAEVAIQYDLAERMDLTKFFDFWVWGGYIPNLEVSWSAKGNGNDMVVSGEITSDVPFGTMDVPVVVKTTDGTEHATWATVVDGKATFETAPIPVQGEFEVLLDPHGFTLAHSREVTQATD